MMSAIVAPVSCEVRAVIRFLCVNKGSSAAAEIHRKLCLVYLFLGFRLDNLSARALIVNRDQIADFDRPEKKFYRFT